MTLREFTRHDIQGGDDIDPVDLSNSQQNAFVQDWLQAYMKEHGYEEHIEATIESVQETYNYKDHLNRMEAS